MNEARWWGKFRYCHLNNKRHLHNATRFIARWNRRRKRVEVLESERATQRTYRVRCTKDAALGWYKKAFDINATLFSGCLKKAEDKASQFHFSYKAQESLPIVFRNAEKRNVPVITQKWNQKIKMHRRHWAEHFIYQQCCATPHSKSYQENIKLIQQELNPMYEAKEAAKYFKIKYRTPLKLIKDALG